MHVFGFCDLYQIEGKSVDLGSGCHKSVIIGGVSDFALLGAVSGQSHS